ncbi:MAG TPA: GlsB/YeaQ/YmgE family stress response membrane protein [Casimicrobiaceae bacterium]|nr:GlsB/YeaQ/YmgE family stress response membrane protein [Casimicrobiaceae bacterium]
MGLLHIIWMIIVGFIIGVLARWFYPGAVTMGFWATAAVGIIGSLVGGVIGGLLWRSPDGKFHPAGFILSIIGALIVLWLYLTFVAAH